MLYLRKLVKTKNDSVGFNAPALCLREGKSSYVEVFFSVDRFYAFKIRDLVLIDIRQEVLSKLF